GLEDRLLRGGDGLPPPPRLGARVLSPAARLRPRRGPARAEVAREVQRARAPHLGRTRLLARARGARGAPRPHLPRPLGQRALPVALPAGAFDAVVAVPDARGVLRDPRARRRLRAPRAVAVAPVGERAAARARDGGSDRARDARRSAHPRAHRAAEAPRPRLPRAHRPAAPDPARGAPARAPRERPLAAALARPPAPRGAVAARAQPLDAGLARPD